MPFVLTYVITLRDAGWLFFDVSRLFQRVCEKNGMSSLLSSLSEDKHRIYTTHITLMRWFLEIGSFWQGLVVREHFRS